MDEATNAFCFVSQQIKFELGIDNLNLLNVDRIVQIRDDPQLEFIMETNKQIIVFESKLVTKKNKFSLSPSIEEWWQALKSISDEYVVEQMIIFKEISAYNLKSDIEKQSYDFNQSSNAFFDDDWASSLRKEKMRNLKEAFDDYFKPLEKMLESLNGEISDDLTELTHFYKDVKKKRFDNEKLNIALFEKYIETNKKLRKTFEVLFKLDSLEVVGFVVDVKETKAELLGKLTDILDSTFDLIVSNNVYLISKMEDDSKAILKMLAKKPNTVEEYHELKEFTEKLNDELESVWKKIDIVF